MDVQRRVAAVRLIQLPLERAFGVAHREQVAAVRRTEGSRTVIVLASSLAAAEGVRAGMSLSDARARCPQLVLREQDPAGERAQAEGAAEVLMELGPVVEVVTSDLLLIELGHGRRVLATLLAARGYAEPEGEPAIARAIQDRLWTLGHAAVVGLADDADTARLLALAAGMSLQQARKKVRGARKTAAPSPHPLPEALAAAVRIAPPGGSAAAIAGLPLSVLDWSWPAEDPRGAQVSAQRTALSSLGTLGVRDVGHLATFPPEQVTTRFGDAGRRLMARARATLERPLTGFVPPVALVESMDLEGGVEALEPILFLLKRLFDRLEVRLEARGMAATAIELAFTLEGTRRVERLRIDLSRPTRASATFHRIARERVSGALSGPVRRVGAEVLSPVSGAGAQLDLFHAQLERLEAAELLVARLQAFLGEEAVLQAELCDTHRPEAAWVARPVALERVLDSGAFVAPPPRRRGEAGALAVSPGNQAALPAVEVLGSVIGADAPIPADAARMGLSASADQLTPAGTPAAALPAQSADPRAWPKPIQRKKEDDPLAPLPPRPLRLYPRPEPAQLSGKALAWRGKRWTLEDMERRERLEAEWWRAEPLSREYVMLTLAEGPWLWAYVDLQDAARTLWVHGSFD